MKAQECRAARKANQRGAMRASEGRDASERRWREWLRTLVLAAQEEVIVPGEKSVDWFQFWKQNLSLFSFFLCCLCVIFCERAPDTRRGGCWRAMSSEDEEEGPSREGELLLAEFRSLQQDVRDTIRAAREENTAYLSELRDACTQVESTQKLLKSE